MFSNDDNSNLKHLKYYRILLITFDTIPERLEKKLSGPTGVNQRPQALVLWRAGGTGSTSAPTLTFSKRSEMMSKVM